MYAKHFRAYIRAFGGRALSLHLKMQVSYVWAVIAPMAQMKQVELTRWAGDPDATISSPPTPAGMRTRSGLFSCFFSSIKKCAMR
ncbi:MAG: hypothetical protein A3D65_00385 [Candidatus Lloydbacteria bacterium RIFCSPHIGHO2_02_FULL_50_13]|uniref:Uncharacterized protein n=1 Tax=Candidatus Lloydbacteria bacterium RIFCSPHIGHO2_02_FULL_50_13 TaxID=1798661 RepID=A0A1G2D422_9BACT|nr:MAG: hypothetical protein A3D65_00385 [Candidatus Lloydbacteria bacterium RIFCSPHIGHO2_02_FULL_50_13]